LEPLYFSGKVRENKQKTRVQSPPRVDNYKALQFGGKVRENTQK